MATIAGILSVALFIGGGIVTSFNTYAAIGLYISSPLPVLVYKVIQNQSKLPPEPEVPIEKPSEDPLPPV